MSIPTSDSRQFEHTLSLQAPREAVWRALTDADEIARWFAPEASIDARVGGAVAWKWRDHFDWHQTIEALEPNEHLRTRYDAWRGQQAEAHPLFVDFHLEGEGGSTTLRIVHSGFGADSRFDQEFDGISGGWPIELESLRLYLERHHGKTRQLVWSRAMVDLDPAAAWRSLAADDAFGCGTVGEGLEPGAAFAFDSADGDHFAGRIIVAGKRELVSVLSSHGDGWLRVWVGGHDGNTMLWLWLATYDQAPPAGLQERWDALLQRVFAGHIKENVAS